MVLARDLNLIREIVDYMKLQSTLFELLKVSLVVSSMESCVLKNIKLHLLSLNLFHMISVKFLLSH